MDGRLTSARARKVMVAAASLAAVLPAACLLPGEPRASERVEFRLEVEEPYRIPLGGTIRPSIEVLVGGSAVANAPYRLESLNDDVVRVDATRQGLSGVRRGTAMVRAVYPSATGFPDTVFAAWVVVSRVDVAPASQSGEARFTGLGETIQLGATAFDDAGGGVPNASFIWSTSDPNVAAVSALGVATAVNEGVATISAGVDGVTGSMPVTVAQTAAAVRLVPELDSLRTVGRSARFIALAFDEANTVLRRARPQWTSSDPTVATVDGAGVATAVGPGSASIIARVGDAADTATLVVKQVARFLVATPGAQTLTALEETGRITVTASDSLGSPIPDPDVAWATNNPAIAVVDATGLARAVSNGPAVITASSGAATAFAAVVVRQEVATARMSHDEILLTGQGATARLSAVALDRNGHPVNGTAFDWRSGQECIATVDASALVTARGDGSAAIIAAPVGGGRPDTAIVVVASAGDPAIGDGQQIAFESARGIEIVTVGGGCGPRLLIANEAGSRVSDPSWSPDGERLAFTRMVFGVSDPSSPLDWGTCGIYTARADGSDVRQVTPGELSDFWCDLQPAWSPVGPTLAFVSGDPLCRYYCAMTLATVNADGSGRVSLGPHPLAYDTWRVNPTWSPDATKVAFEESTSYTRGRGISVINTDGTGWRALTTPTGPPGDLDTDGYEDVQPSWSPNGSELAFVRSGDIWVMNSDGSSARNLTQTPVNEYQPSWSPDGTHLLFVIGGGEGGCWYRGLGCPARSRHVYMMARDGSGRVPLISSHGYQLSPAWRPRR